MGKRQTRQSNTAAEPVVEPVDANGLTDKQRVFIDMYFINGLNQTRAYMSVYPDADYPAARSSASRLITNANVRAEIERRLTQHALTANEALARLANEARGDLADVFTDDGEFDFKTAKARGQTAIIKKLKRKRSTRHTADDDDNGVVIDEHFEIELYDAQAAQLALLKEWRLDSGKPTERFAMTWRDLVEQARNTSEGDSGG